VRVVKFRYMSWRDALGGVVGRGGGDRRAVDDRHADRLACRLDQRNALLALPLLPAEPDEPAPLGVELLEEQPTTIAAAASTAAMRVANLRRLPMDFTLPSEDPPP